MNKKVIKVCVHGPGVFHADDVLCVALVGIENPDAHILTIRSRDEKKFKDANLVMDVGGKYELNMSEGTSFYDHHQKDIPVYENGIKYAACGLYLENMKSLSARTKKYLLDHALYGVQARDNGQDINLKEYPNPFSFISLYNCDWKTGVYSKEQDKMFGSAVIIARSILKCLIRDAELEEEAETQVYNAIESSHKGIFDGVIDIGNYCPWTKTVINYNEGRSARQIKAIIFRNQNGEYQCQVVPKQHGSFEAWCSIPPEVSELPGFVFRHPAAFLAGFNNHDSAVRAAVMAVKSEEKKDESSN